ncbi:MAG TPA: AAA domain-containing protein [Kofleriaceae bacterium]|nr:AAA domain-containing protein [Kofleriaceae bacterium]
MEALLAKFVAAFERGIAGEVEAMRASAQTFEIPLGDAADLGTGRYRFTLAAAQALAVGSVGVLRTRGGEQTATVEGIDHRDGTRGVTLAVSQPIAAGEDATLVVAPWFLYERLTQALARIGVERHSVGLAMTLFGKRPHVRAATALRCEHDALNASQRAAVQLCSDSELAFVWGPPGTGKTVTLTHVIEELLAQGKRILLASTTNAAIDQVLAKLATRPWFAGAVDTGTVIRLGRSDAETFGAELADVVARRYEAHHASVGRLRARIGEVGMQLRYGQALVDELAAASAAQQSLFAEPPRARSGALSSLYSPGLAEVIGAMEPRAQLRVIRLRLERLERVRVLAKARVATHAAAARDLEARVVANARVVMCTLTNAYLSPLMTDERFDVLIAEEAGMAPLPTLFYAASLCKERAIMVGDPRQLPPIVQSSEPLVRRTIGRNIFEVAIEDPATSDVVAMLDVQYRMHPAIGALVGGLFYGDRLVHRGDPAVLEAIVARAPFPGRPLAIVDTRASTACERSAKGSSRVNPRSAQITAALALEAVRDGASSVAVITPYAAHAVEIRRLLAAQRIADVVECSTIHRFQGRECDVVVIDLVDAAPMRPSALLAEAPNLLNVSISRARGKLVIVADVAYFRSVDPSGIVARMLDAGARVLDGLGRAIEAAAR